MSDDILKELEDTRKADFHDPAWLKRQEDQLRAHMKASPLPATSSHLMSKILIVAVLVIGAFVLVANKYTPPGVYPTPSQTETPSITQSPTPTADPSATPAPTGEPSPIVTLTPTPVQTPSISRTPRP